MRAKGRSRGIVRGLYVGIIVIACATASVVGATSREPTASDATSPKPSRAAAPKPLVPPWKPPALESPTRIVASDSNNRLFLEPDKDYVVTMATPITTRGGLWIVGGRNVVLVGGEIQNETLVAEGESADNGYGLLLKDQTGTIHVEGLWIHGRGIGQAIVLEQNTGATVQVLRTRLEALHPVGTVHTDGIQSWAGPARLRLWNVTIRTAGVGLQTQPHQFAPVAVAAWQYRRVNIEQTTGAAYALWKDPQQGGWWPEYHKEFWVKRRGNLAWPSLRHWNPNGPAGVLGEKLRLGTPKGGDFAPVGSVGLSYTRPSTR